jgi:UDP-N-acetylmuramyl pentapeptide phosphotransferase/UDP-N-acetylglucosamine-1-phosphate transferase
MDLVLQIIIPSVVALFAVRWVYFRILKIAKNKDLVDDPDARKLQKEPVPVMGGIAVFWGMVSGVFVGAAVAAAFGWVRLWPILPVVFSMVLMLYAGAMDDVIGLLPGNRFFIEIVTLLCLIYTTGICADSLHGLWGVETISWWIAVPLTVFGGVGIINAVNMIDGVNGLSSGMCIVCCLLFGVIFFMADDAPNAVLAFVMATALVPFFMHNVFGNTSRMFIGDAGTMMMGVLLAWFTFSVIHRNTDAVFQINGNEVNMIAMALAILSVPVFDTVRVMIWRIRHHKSPFHPDKTHLHHVFISMGVSHSITALTEIVIDLIVVGIAVLAVYLGANKDWQLYTVIITGVVLICGTYFFLRLQLRCHTRLAERMTHLSLSTHLGDKRWWLRLQHWLDRPESQLKS